MRQDHPDVVIRGAGVFGLAIGFACARRGASVLVVDPNGVAGGASGGPVGALAPHVPDPWNAKKAFQLDSLLAAPAFWAAVGETSGQVTGYGKVGRLQPLPDAAAVARARARADAAREVWRGSARWEVVAAAEAGAWAPVSPSGWLVHDTLSARLDPPRACAALAAAILCLGGTVAREGPEEAPAVVWADGASGLARLSAGRSRPVGAGVKGQAARLAFDRRGAPQIYADGLHIVPHDDGTTGIGSTSETDFADGTATDRHLDDVLARARAVVPALGGAPVIARWAGIRPRARTRAPMLGRHPERPGHFIANGGFKIGFGMAPAVAEVMANLVLDGHNRVPEGFGVTDNF